MPTINKYVFLIKQLCHYKILCYFDKTAAVDILMYIQLIQSSTYLIFLKSIELFAHQKFIVLGKYTYTIYNKTLIIINC